MTARIERLPNTVPRQKWVDLIGTAWREQVPAIFETGNLLEAAKEELKHGEWLVMVRDELPFNQSTARKLIAIADNDNLRNRSHENALPAKWTVLYELTKLTDEQFKTGIKSGVINPKMERKDANALRGIEPKAKKKEDEPRRAWSIDRVHMWLRNTALEAFDDLDPNDWPELIATLREEIVELEKIAEKRGQTNAA